jgi:hypothetical protein
LEARYVDFKFDRVLEEQVVTPPAADAPPGTPPTTSTRYSVVPSKLTVPLLSILPIPYIRISDMTIDFEFEIKDVESRESTSVAKVSTEAKGGFWFFKASVKGSYSNRTVNKRQTDRRTSLKITVNAVQDEIPEGLGRVLDILHDSIKVVPLGTATPIPGAVTGPAIP